MVKHDLFCDCLECLSPGVKPPDRYKHPKPEPRRANVGPAPYRKRDYIAGGALAVSSTRQKWIMHR